MNSELEGCGVVFCAQGSLYVKAALRSAASLEKIHPSLPVTVFTDNAGALEIKNHGDKVRVVKIENMHKRSKIDSMFMSPYSRTLYLDCDTLVVGDVLSGFLLLEKFDLLICHAHARTLTALEDPDISVPIEFCQFNSGVMYFSESFKVVAREWLRRFKDGVGEKDQVALRRILWFSNIRFFVLPREYNVRYRKSLLVAHSKQYSARVLHFRTFTSRQVMLHFFASLFPSLPRNIKHVFKR